ncbi:hypothetical protein [Maricaulis sp. CAU 1757]
MFDSPRLHRLLFWLALLLLTIAVLRYAGGVWFTLGYRAGLIPLEQMPAGLQLSLPTIPAWRDAVYLAGFAGTLAALVLVALRRAQAVWVYIIGGALARLDWALLPTPQTATGQLMSYSTFVTYLLLVTLLLILRHNRVLR